MPEACGLPHFFCPARTTAGQLIAGFGSGNGLKRDDIPLSAQVVSLADVYDALVSERVYKKAFSHEKAIQMILNGECGTFNPVLLECLLDIQRQLKQMLIAESENAYEYAVL